MSKISGYANSVSALGTDDLIDVSEKISSSPDVYESRKMTGAILAAFIQNYTNDSIYSASGTVPSSVVATITDFLRFSGGRLDLSTTTDGFLMPRLTTAQMNAIASPTTNLLIYNTDLSGLYRYDGAAWVALSTGYGVVSVNDSSGQPTFYADLQTAVNAAGAEGVVYLHSDITQNTEVTLPAGTGISFTINGNGHKITHTSDTGSEYSLFFVGSGNNKKFYLNNIKIESNGTSTSNSTGAVFRGNPSGGSFELFFEDNTYIKSINNAIIYLSNCYGGILESENSYVNFGSSVITVKNAQVTTKFGRSNFVNCDIIINTGGSIGNQSTEISGCKITCDADTNVPIDNLLRNCKFWNNTVICNSGSNNAIETRSSTPGNFINIYGCKIYHYGTGTALRGVYISDIHNCYIYAESNIALYVLRTDNGHSRYNIKDVTCVTNSTSNPAFFDQQGSTIDAFRIKGLTAICKNALNTSSAMFIQVRAGDGPMYMTDCEAVVFNPSVKNITFSDTGTVYMYNVLVSEVGTGIDFGTVTLGNVNTLDAYGNGQIG